MTISAVGKILILYVFSINMLSVELRVPVVEENPETHLFYVDLLEQSFQLIQEPLLIILVKAPQIRLGNNLRSDKIDLLWMIESEARNDQFARVQIGLTAGLIGKRVFLIREDDQSAFNKIQDLEDLRDSGLVAGFGQGWYDSKVWEANNLQYIEQLGNWQSIYPKLANRRDFDYFPRGVNEIVPEATVQDRLVIESNLVLEYQRDFIFYLSESGLQKQTLMSRALESAQSTGLIDRLVQKYWGEDLIKLNYNNRIVIKLNTPD